MSEENNQSGIEGIFDKVLEKTGFKTLVKLQPNSPGEKGDEEIDDMLAMLGLRKVGKPIVVIDTLSKKTEKTST